MNKYHAFAILIIIAAIVILGYSATIGESEVIWFLIFPIFIGQGIYSFLGTILIILAIFVGIYGFIQGGDWVLAGEDEYDELFGSRKKPKYGKRQQPRPGHQNRIPEPRPRAKVRGGGVVLIGPVPIIFGSDKNSAIILSILAIIIMIIAVIAIFGGFFLVS
jgi:uncharacterized protein (TIGR00304 family)